MSNAPEETERRRYPREKLHQTLVVAPADAPDESHRAVLMNISEGGCRIVTDNPLEEGARFVLTIGDTARTGRALASDTRFNGYSCRVEFDDSE